MRYIGIALVLSFMIPFQTVDAQDNPGKPLYGTWRLISFSVQVVGEDVPPRDIFGPTPFGRLILTPEHTMMAYLSRHDRKPPINDAEAAALLSSMIAYTGKFRLEDDKLITTVDGAWNETYKANEQIRYINMDGDKLSIRTAEQPSGTMPGKRVVGTFSWEREK